MEFCGDRLPLLETQDRASPVSVRHDPYVGREDLLEKRECRKTWKKLEENRQALRRCAWNSRYFAEISAPPRGEPGIPCSRTAQALYLSAMHLGQTVC